MIALTFCSGGEGAVYQYGEIPKPCVFVQIPRGFSQTEVEERERGGVGGGSHKSRGPRKQKCFPIQPKTKTTSRQYPLNEIRFADTQLILRDKRNKHSNTSRPQPHKICLGSNEALLGRHQPAMTVGPQM